MGVKPVESVDPTQLTIAEFRQYRTICAALFGMYKESIFHYGPGAGRGTAMTRAIPPNSDYPDVSFDCSAFVTWCFKVAGSPDPNGASFTGGISTASLWVNGRLVGGPTVAEKELLPADLCFYGYEPEMHGGNSEHVTIYIDKGLCISHGSEHGPLVLPYKPGSGSSSKPLVGVRRYEF